MGNRAAFCSKPRALITTLPDVWVVSTSEIKAWVSRYDRHAVTYNALGNAARQLKGAAASLQTPLRHASAAVNGTTARIHTVRCILTVSLINIKFQGIGYQIHNPTQLHNLHVTGSSAQLLDLTDVWLHIMWMTHYYLSLFSWIMKFRFKFKIYVINIVPHSLHIQNVKFWSFVDAEKLCLQKLGC